MKDPETGSHIEMSVFMIFYRAESIRVRIQRVVEAFGAHAYQDVPDFNNLLLLDEW